jgi:tRNA(Ile)-lysidine synthase
MFCTMLEKRVISFILEHDLIDPDDRVMIGVSGGPDSVFLLDLLSSYSKKLRFKLCCCHIDHGLRGEASRDDERLVEELALEREIPFVAKRIDCVSYSELHRISLEEAARSLRLATLSEIAGEHDAQEIALGHTADDNAETFLMNLLRGTGRKGLCGIQPKRGDIIHPLLCIRRSEIIRYLKEKRIGYRVDVTNWHTHFTRNFIRHELVPLMEKGLERNVKSNILRLIEIIASEEEVLAEMTGRIFSDICSISAEGISIGRSDFKKVNPAMQNRLILRCFDEVAEKRASLNSREVCAIRRSALGESSGSSFLHHGVEYLIGADSLFIGRRRPVKGGVENELILSTSDEVTFHDKFLIKTRILSEINGDLSNPDCAYFDLEKLVMPLTIRKRRNGDVFVPFGMAKKKKVKELLIDTKVDFWARDMIPIVSDARGIIWVAGVRRSADAMVDQSTKRILKIEKRTIG